LILLETLIEAEPYLLQFPQGRIGIYQLRQRGSGSVAGAKPSPKISIGAGDGPAHRRGQSAGQLWPLCKDVTVIQGEDLLQSRMGMCNRRDLRCAGTSMIRILVTEAISARESIDLLAFPVSVSLTRDGCNPIRRARSRSVQPNSWRRRANCRPNDSF
jgi:hypothetical protein